MTYRWCSQRFLQSVTDWNNLVTSYTYAENGSLYQLSRPNGVVSTYTVNDVGWLTDLTHTGSEADLAIYHYAYGPVGNRWQAVETVYAPNFLYLPVVLNQGSGTQALSLEEALPEAGLDSITDPYPAPVEPDMKTEEENPYPAPDASESVSQGTSFWEQVIGFFAWLFSPADVVQASGLDQAYPAPGSPPANPPLLPAIEITYLYDPLHRLTQADDSSGSYFHYAYDSNGNRLTETTQAGTKTSSYDVANRLTGVDGVSYTWDDNGNLLSDGTNTYTYNHANRLVGVSRSGLSASYQYNGLGDRVSETNNGVTTSFTLDLNAGLTQALSDGTNTYLYGINRMMQQSATGTDYFLPDALGSVRQLASAAGEVTLTQSFSPYGEQLSRTGAGDSSFGFTGEWKSSTNLLYLRSRYYSLETGRFLTRDTWQGDYTTPVSNNAWLYAFANPINRVDPSGYSPLGPIAFGECFSIVAIPPNGRWLGMSAGMAVEICKTTYNKDAWGFSIKPGQNLPTTTGELFAWYINEYGDDHLYFNGTHPLTQELATSVSIHDIRTLFYRDGDLNKALYKFNGSEILASLLIDTRHAWLPLTQFLGSYWYQVKKLDNGRVGFRIDNDTTLSSGSHFAGRFEENGFGGSVEELIERNPSIANEPIEKVIKESRVISVLRNRTRSDTQGSFGGGTMYQTFTWTERYDECLPKLLPWEVLRIVLDIRIWSDFETHSEAVFP